MATVGVKELKQYAAVCYQLFRLIPLGSKLFYELNCVLSFIFRLSFTHPSLVGKVELSHGIYRIFIARCSAECGYNCKASVRLSDVGVYVTPQYIKRA